MVRSSVPCAAVVAALAGGCEAPADVAGRLLVLAPAESEVVVLVEPARVAGTWLDRAVAAQVGGAVPACVLDAARAAALVVVAWAPDEGVLLALAGAPAAATAGCDELERRGPDRLWADGVEPAGRRADGYFGERERRQRWSELPAAPVMAVADLALAAGLVVEAAGTADASDGLTARVRVTTEDRETSLSLRERYLRWRGDLDEDRLGGAWPAIAAITTAEDRRDPDRTTDLVEVRLPGDDGASAAALAIAALASGLGGAGSRLPCPDSLGDFAGRARCDRGELTFTEELVAELLDRPHQLTDGVRLVPTRQGSTMGLRLNAVSPYDAMAWLGFENGDVILDLDGEPMAAPIEIVLGLETGGPAREVGVLRRGERGSLRFRVR